MAEPVKSKRAVKWIHLLSWMAKTISKENIFNNWELDNKTFYTGNYRFTTPSITILSKSTLSITTVSIMTLSIMPFGITTLSIMTVSRSTLSIITLSIKTFSTTTLSLRTLNVTQHKNK
jgi:hypothetical protein